MVKGSLLTVEIFAGIREKCMDFGAPSRHNR